MILDDVLRTPAAIRAAEAHTAHNYHPLPVVIATGEGAWVTDIDGRRYLDFLAGYSALNFGHRHPALIGAAHAQLDRVTLTSRAFVHDQFAAFCSGLAELCGKDQVLPMNTGAEAVETAIKLSRKWGYQVKGVPADQATIVVADGNFHGRTTTIISFSTDPDAHDDFGPYTPGFRLVPYGDLAAMAEAIDETTVAVLIEPIQGEQGVVVPPAGYLPGVRALCTERDVLFVADEIQSGLGRTGDTFACDDESVVPDVYILGKALGGGIVPVSAVAANADVLGVIKPGQHGSTFGGNPLACAVAIEVVKLLRTGEFQARAKEQGAYLHAELQTLVGEGLLAVRGRGLWAGIDVDPALMTGREACERLAERGILAKDTHGSTLRLAPPLIIDKDDIDVAISALRGILK
ncbi:ornithine--oxo-acid transaminase [Asanoa siamensis]|uniref:ornithine aminotransferase n=1 Tax=Asanoa siamensis TaxID=926357 RepID=A0ABQ4CU96_9ACTN|nr:ornithine--oxo-acid transaminase [Asanoa siamensis]GIF74573.1 ornithine--oxo-acid transaminase [Asanoa siamensis]